MGNTQTKESKMPFGFPDKAGALEPINAASTVSQEMARTRPQRMSLEPKTPGPEPTPQRLAMENLAYYGGPSVSHQKELSDTEPIRKRRVEQVIAPDYFTTRRERRASREATLGIIMAPQMRPGVSVSIAHPVAASVPAPRMAPSAAGFAVPQGAPPMNSRQHSSVMATAAPERGVPANDVQSRRKQLLERIALASKSPATQLRHTGAGAVSLIPQPSVKQAIKVGTPNPARVSITVAPPSERPLLQTEAPAHAAQARSIRERSRRTTAMKAAQIDDPVTIDKVEDQISLELPVSVRARSRRVQPGGIKTPVQIASAVAAAPITPKPPAPKEPESDMLRTLLEQNKLMSEQNHMMYAQISLLQSQINEMQVTNTQQQQQQQQTATPVLEAPKMVFLEPSQDEIDRPPKDFQEYMRKMQANAPATPPSTPESKKNKFDDDEEEEKQPEDADFEDAMMETATLVASQILEVNDVVVEEKQKEEIVLPVPPFAAFGAVPEQEPVIAKTSVRGRRKKT